MIPNPIRFLPLFAALPVSVIAQDWASAIAGQWPGTAVAKATAAEFAAFAKTIGGDQKPGLLAFVAVQHQALGLPVAAAAEPTSTVVTDPMPAMGEAAIAETEPNDNPGSANAIACGDHVEAALLAGDSDWFTFTVAQPGLLTLYTNPGPGGAVTDTVVELRDAAQQLLAVNDDARGLFSVVRGNVVPGTYVVRVRHFSATGAGDYSLDVSCSAGPTVLQEAAEPNDQPATATLGACGVLAFGSINPAGDSDWYAVTLDQPGVMVATTGGSQVGPTLQDSTLTLWDATGTVQIAFDDDAGPGLFARIVQPLAAGTYHVAVAGFQNSIGRYSLTVDCAPAQVAQIQEAQEPNDTVPTATQFACNFTGNGDLAVAQDRDFWVFTVTQNARLVVTNGPGTTGTPIADPTLTLRRLDGSIVAFDDDGGPGRYSLLDVEVPQGSYVIDAAGFQNEVGTYVLDLICLPGQNASRALYTLFPGGCPGSNASTPAWSVRPLEVPLLGTTFVGEFSNLLPNGAVVAFAGFSRVISSTGLPLPFDLGPLGASGCSIDVDPASVTLLLANGAGVATWAIPIPYLPALISADIFQQGLALDPAANALGAAASNHGRAVIGERL
ncbi:MAG: hypothetical protein IPK26_29955 [Planctomycetes bacterium]|nr:hypothetical protein [Planctomycetota bacterium]